MVEQAKRKADSGGPEVGAGRKPVSRVAAWIEEARFNRSLVGPGAHRTAYRRLVGVHEQPEEEPRPRPALPVTNAANDDPEALREEPVPAEPVETPPPAAPAETVQRARRSPPRRIAPRRRPQQQRATRGRTTLFAVSALAAGFVSAPFGYWAYDLVDDDFPSATGQYLSDAKSSNVPAAAQPVPTATDLAAAKAAVAPVQSASVPAEAVSGKRESLTVTEVAKEESDAPYRSLAEAASLNGNAPAPDPEPADDIVTETSKALAVADPAPEPARTAKVTDRLPAAEEKAPSLPQPDPRAAALIEDGEALVEQGEIASARRFFERAAELGEPKALVQLARTYDPVVLKELKVVGLKPEPDKAVELYERARAIMSGEVQGGRLGPSAWLTR
ncbi:MAG: hypothetical protein AB7S41_13865 [Parvibaculaceae bacterium]